MRALLLGGEGQAREETAAAWIAAE